MTINKISKINLSITETKQITLKFMNIFKIFFLPIFTITIPIIQCINYFFYYKLLGNFEKYQNTQTILTPYILGPLSNLITSIGNVYIHYENITEKEFIKDIKENNCIIYGNHVRLTDFFIAMHMANNYNVLHKLAVYYMKDLKYYPVIGPSLYGQFPLSRNREKDELFLTNRINEYKNINQKYLYCLFPEGGLSNNRNLFHRTQRKCKELNIDLKYVNFPKVSGFTKLINMLGHKIGNIYQIILMYNYDDNNCDGYRNDVHLIIKKMCNVNSLPSKPSEEYKNKLSSDLIIDENNSLHYAHEEFFLNNFLKIDSILNKWYEDNTFKPTCDNLSIYYENK